MSLYWWNEAEGCRQRRTFSLSSKVPLAILVLTAVCLKPIHCLQAPIINRMRSQSAGSNVRTMVSSLIAGVTNTANAGGPNGANECDCNTKFPYFKCQCSLIVMARTCVCVRVCVISLWSILDLRPIRFCTAEQFCCLFVHWRERKKKRRFHQKYNLSP